MKKLGYGKHYSYNPDFAHPVYNVCLSTTECPRPCLDLTSQEYLPPTLSSHSSLSDRPDDHFLKKPDAELREKTWDEERLKEWESQVNGDARWAGRRRREAGSHDA